MDCKVKIVFIAKSIILVLLCTISMHGQSYWFGGKGGFTMASQSSGEGGFSRNQLFGGNGDVFIETFDEFNKGSLYASLGYHLRGSALRYFSFNGGFSAVQAFKYQNIALEIGGKKTIFAKKSFAPYFLIGIRGEYTIGTNFSNFNSLNSIFIPEKTFVQKLNYGITFGGGFDTYLNEMSNIFFEVVMQPDLSVQYRQPPLVVSDPIQIGQTISLPLTESRNLTIEFKLGLKFLRKVEYID